jgi:hypothetical protein
MSEPDFPYEKKPIVPIKDTIKPNSPPMPNKEPPPYPLKTQNKLENAKPRRRKKPS